MMDCDNSQYWISRYELEPHPEGGFYKETYRSHNVVSRENTSTARSAVSSIYYLLEGTDYSGFHRIQSDELWYFHKGTSLNVYVINESGELEIMELSDLATGTLSGVVKAGLWFAASIKGGQGYSLVSCAVAPGFDFGEFEMAKKSQLLAEYPHLSEIINKMCRD